MDATHVTLPCPHCGAVTDAVARLCGRCGGAMTATPRAALVSAIPIGPVTPSLPRSPVPAPPVRRAGRWRAAVLALALASCGFDVAGDQPMAVPDVYRTWWAKTETCSGLAGDFDRVRWEVVPGASFTCSTGQCVGHWESDHRIWIADQYVNNEMVVRHEMLHELIGHSGHPNPPFGEGCPLTWATWTGSD